MSTWNPDLYLKYEAERTQPSYDLVARIRAANPQRVVDIGCGPGNSTRVLKERWPGAYIVGMDNSQEMIAKAQKAYPQEEWILADANRWSPPGQYDVVFSNAVLQWMPDHASLVPRLFSWVERGGALAVQMPANHDSPLHQSARLLAQRSPWKERLAGYERAQTVHDAAAYYDWLSALSAQVYIWYTTYYHVMPDHQALLDWFSGTGLRPYLEQLGTAEQREAFQRELLAEYRLAYPPQPDGKVLLPFRRLFFIAYRD
jgi:trans-aconitate 2-methyltransferase